MCPPFFFIEQDSEAQRRAFFRISQNNKGRHTLMVSRAVGSSFPTLSSTVAPVSPDVSAEAAGIHLGVNPDQVPQRQALGQP